MILRKNCYGLPAAGKAWADHRDKFMLEYFNDEKKGYRCQKCVYDPTLFYITKGDRIRLDKDTTPELRPFKEEAWVSIHTDDCDGYSTSKSLLEEIYKSNNTRWKAKVVSSDFMLGIKRQRTQVLNDDKTIKSDAIDFTMTPYVDGMYNAFSEYIKPTHHPSTPFPVNLVLSKHSTVDPAESETVLDRGYMRAIGMLLWAARGCFPECAQGVNQLGSMMAKPTEESWDAAMHMIAWMYTQRERGIRFSKDAPVEPTVFTDASNKPDVFDGLCRYGHCTMVAGGPVTWSSKKLAHVGLSAFHNEYMALRHAASQAVWLYNISKEIGCAYMTHKPIKVYGDNLAANRLAKEHFISTGNQYIYLPYFWTKELVEKGIIEVPYVSTKLNVSDIFTKAVSKQVMDMLLMKTCGYETDWYDQLTLPTAGLKQKVSNFCEYFTHTDVEEHRLSFEIDTPIQES